MNSPLSSPGDCDDSFDCAYGLICYQRSSDELSVPGCDGIPTDSTDYCTYPWMVDQLVAVGNNNLAEKLDVCQGDCDEVRFLANRYSFGDNDGINSQ